MWCNPLLLYFLASIFMFIYGVYAHTLAFAFIFLTVAISIAVYYFQDMQLKECRDKLLNE